MRRLLAVCLASAIACAGTPPTPGAAPTEQHVSVSGGVGTTLPVDLLVSGCPPTPERILAGLRALLEANARSKAAVSSRS